MEEKTNFEKISVSELCLMRAVDEIVVEFPQVPIDVLLQAAAAYRRDRGGEITRPNAIQWIRGRILESQRA